MGVVAFQAVAHRGAVDHSLALRSVFVRMAGQAEAHRSGGNQFYARDIFVDSNFVTNIAPEGDCGMDCFALDLILVALGALGGVCVLIKGNRMYVRKSRYAPKQDQADERRQLPGYTPHITAPLEREMRHGDPLPLMQTAARIALKLVGLLESR